MRKRSPAPAPRKLFTVVEDELATPMLRLHLSPFSPDPPVESCQALPLGSVIASICSCCTELMVVSAWLSPVTFELPQPPVVNTPRLTGMSAQMKSLSGVSPPDFQP